MQLYAYPVILFLVVYSMALEVRQFLANPWKYWIFLSNPIGNEQFWNSVIHSQWMDISSVVGQGFYAYFLQLAFSNPKYLLRP